MDITNTIRLYAECISGGAITEPTGGSWMSAICVWQGTPTPLNSSYLQRHCDNLGITQPVNGSFIIALANHYGESQPINGTWANAVLVGCGAVPSELIWNLDTTEWQDEVSPWKTAAAPAAPTNDGGTFSVPLPIITGTAINGNLVILEVDGTTYTDIPVSGGVWSLQTTTLLGGSASPGTAYPVTTTQKDPSTGLVGAADVTNINIIATAVSVTIDLFDSYGDGWNDGWMELQQETAPGVWTALNLPNYQTYGRYLNAAYTGTFVLYWNAGSFPTGTTGMKFETYDPLSAPPNSPGRSWLQLIDTYIFDLDPANYRLVSGASGSFQTERSATIKETIGGAVLGQVASQAAWQPGNVLGTFTVI